MRFLTTRCFALLALIVAPAMAPAAFAQAGPPAMTLDKSALTFGALTSGATFSAQTTAQQVRLMQSGAGAVTWTATPSQPWLVVSPASGTGPATLNVSVAPSGGVPPTGTLTGAVTVTYNGATTASGAVGVTLRLKPAGTSAAPLGTVDTPIDNAVGITGAFPFTGWAVDDIQIARVSLCRAAVSGEPVGLDDRCGSQAQIYVGDAVFIDGARPDVQSGYASYPRNSQAGWGLMVLTNMLPAQGNGVYSFFTWAQDVEGGVKLLGQRTITCDNAHATLPFGTIDTPGQGETVSSSPYRNYGWALTQNPK